MTADDLIAVLKFANGEQLAEVRRLLGKAEPPKACYSYDPNRLTVNQLFDHLSRTARAPLNPKDACGVAYASQAKVVARVDGTAHRP